MGLFCLVAQLQMLASGANGADRPDRSRGRSQFNGRLPASVAITSITPAGGGSAAAPAAGCRFVCHFVDDECIHLPTDFVCDAPAAAVGTSSGSSPFSKPLDP